MSRRNAYCNRLKATLDGVVEHLRSKGIAERHLRFGGEGHTPARKPSLPTNANSEFLANRAMGDWAERGLSSALVRALPEWKVVQYGSTDRIAAGHADFKARYLAGLEETRLYGKRPDLLIFPANASVPSDISEFTHADTESMAKRAIAAVEVRSSKFDALTYMAVRQRQRHAGNKTGRATPSFTVKVEDLVIVYRWIERHCVPQSYCQIFFDSVFAIDFLDIFDIIGSGRGFTIETPRKSQEKATVMIPITRGRQLGSAIAAPTFAAEHRVTELGRHDAYVVPEGGGFELSREATIAVFLA